MIENEIQFWLILNWHHTKLIALTLNWKKRRGRMDFFLIPFSLILEVDIREKNPVWKQKYFWDTKVQLIVPLLASFPFKEHITFLNKNSNVNITSSAYFILIALMFKNRTQKLFMHYKAAKENQSHILVPNQKNVANITKVRLFLFVPVLIVKGLVINNKKINQECPNLIFIKMYFILTPTSLP